MANLVPPIIRPLGAQAAPKVFFGARAVAGWVENPV